MHLTPDTIEILKLGPVTLNATILFTWLIMVILLLIAWLATRKLSSGPDISRWQNLLETIISYMRTQIREITLQNPDQYVPFLGTLFLFIALANLLVIVPGYHAPTGSLSTTAALAVCVLFAVPIYGIGKKGFLRYLKQYSQPSIFMMPFNIIGEISRTLALAVRLFGNVMSGSIIAMIVLSIAPLFVPILMNALSVLIGLIQAYIFAILAAVYISSATRVEEQTKKNETIKENEVVLKNKINP